MIITLYVEQCCCSTFIYLLFSYHFLLSIWDCLMFFLLPFIISILLSYSNRNWNSSDIIWAKPAPKKYMRYWLCINGHPSSPSNKAPNNSSPSWSLIRNSSSTLTEKSEHGNLALNVLPMIPRKLSARAVCTKELMAMETNTRSSGLGPGHNVSVSGNKALLLRGWQISIKPWRTAGQHWGCTTLLSSLDNSTVRNLGCRVWALPHCYSFSHLSPNTWRRRLGPLTTHNRSRSVLRNRLLDRD